MKKKKKFTYSALRRTSEESALQKEVKLKTLGEISLEVESWDSTLASSGLVEF